MKPTKGQIEEILDGIEAQSSILTKEELKGELVESGVDVDALLARTKILVQKHMKAERTVWMKEADQKRDILESAVACVSSWFDRTEEEIRVAFAALSGSTGTAVAFRNQGNLSVEDMARILQKHDELKNRSGKNSGHFAS